MDPCRRPLRVILPLSKILVVRMKTQGLQCQEGPLLVILRVGFAVPKEEESLVVRLLVECSNAGERKVHFSLGRTPGVGPLSSPSWLDQSLSLAGEICNCVLLLTGSAPMQREWRRRCWKGP